MLFSRISLHQQLPNLHCTLFCNLNCFDSNITLQLAPIESTSPFVPLNSSLGFPFLPAQTTQTTTVPQHLFPGRPFICLSDSEMTNKIYLRKLNNRTNDAAFFTGLSSVMYRTFRLINEIIKTRGDNGVDSSTANITLGIDISLSTEADKCCQQINARPVFYLHVSCTRLFGGRVKNQPSKRSPIVGDGVKEHKITS